MRTLAPLLPAAAFLSYDRLLTCCLSSPLELADSLPLLPYLLRDLPLLLYRGDAPEEAHETYSSHRR